MKTQGLSVKWIRFCMLTLSAGALSCAGDPSRRQVDDGQLVAGAGGASEPAGGLDESAGGNPSESAGGSPNESAGGSPNESAGGNPSESAGGSPNESAGGSPSDTDPSDTAVEWDGAASGSFPGGDGSGMPCGDLEAALLHDQAELDQWAIDQGIAASLEFIVDWTRQTAVGVVTQCSSTGHVITGGDLVHDGSGWLKANFTVIHVVPSFAAPTVAWAVFDVDGRAWTGVSATTIE
jgi:hypothetical protein